MPREVRWLTTKFGLRFGDWNPAVSDLEEIAQGMGVGEAICTRREVVAIVDRSKILKTKKP